VLGSTAYTTEIVVRCCCKAYMTNIQTLLSSDVDIQTLHSGTPVSSASALGKDGCDRGETPIDDHE
jgi:hypothetical protein